MRLTYLSKDVNPGNSACSPYSLLRILNFRFPLNPLTRNIAIITWGETYAAELEQPHRQALGGKEPS
jgi:hypothetical protein